MLIPPSTFRKKAEENKYKSQKTISFSNWLLEFKRGLNVEKIREIYLKKGIFLDDLVAKEIIKSFPKVIDPLLKRYVEKEYIKYILQKRLKIKIDDELAIKKLNEIRWKKQRINNYWNNLSEKERKIIKEVIKKHNEKILNKYFDKGTKKEGQHDNFPAIIGLILVISSVSGLVGFSTPILTGQISGNIFGFNTSELIVTTLIWTLSFILGIFLLYTNLKEKREKTKSNQDIPLFYRSQEI